MKLTRRRALLLVGSFLALFSSTTLAIGCGTPDSAGSSGAAVWTSDALADRYDDLFPDDRVVTVRILMEAADWEAMRGNVRAKEYYRADIWFDDELVKDVAVRTKGSSSLMQASSSDSDRAGLKVDFNFFNAERTYHGVKKLCYSNGFSDPTLMKEFLSYELMAAMGIPTPRACFVDLWVNDAHLGVYTQVEAVDGRFVADNFSDGFGNLYKPEIAAGRLDWTEADAIAETSNQVPSTTTTTTESINLGGGNLDEIIDRLGDDAGWIPGRTETTEASDTVTTAAGAVQIGGGGPRIDIGGGAGQGPRFNFGDGGFMNQNSDYLTSVGLKTNEGKADHSRLFALLEVLNAEPGETSTDDLEQVLDVDEVLRFLAVSTALVHLDNYIGMGHNYYLYDDGGKFSIIPWDLNMSFGGFDSGLSEEKILNFFIDEPTSASVDQYPLVEQLLSEPEYLETYHGYLRELIEGPFSVERMTFRINEIADLIRPYVEKDGNVSLGQFEQGLTENLTNDGRTWNMGGSFIGLAYFVEERTASIAAQLSGEQPASNGDGSGNGGSVGIGGMGGRPMVRQGYVPEGMPAPADTRQQPAGPDGAAPGGGQMPLPPADAGPTTSTTTTIVPTGPAGGATAGGD
jgi:spore coat protein CotH